MPRKKIKRKVFLDTNVILCYLSGDPRCERLFEKSALRDYQYVVNPIVVQELFHAIEFSRARGKMKRRDLNKLLSRLEVTELGGEKEISDFAEFSKSRNFIVHANDLLNINTALRECDFFVTLDVKLLNLDRVGRTKFLSPSKFLSSELREK